MADGKEFCTGIYDYYYAETQFLFLFLLKKKIMEMLADFSPLQTHIIHLMYEMIII